MTNSSSPASQNSGLRFALLREMARVIRAGRESRGLYRVLAVIFGYILRSWYPQGQRTTDHFDVTVEYDSRLLINTDSKNYLEWNLFFYDAYQIGNPLLLKRLVRPGFVCIDVGANIGSYTLLMAEIVGREGQVIAIEPQPEERSKLQAHLMLNRLSNVKVLPYAISDTPGQMTLYAPAEKTGARPNASLLRENVFRGAEVEIPVEARTLDSLVQEYKLERVDLIKTDTEGYEYHVLMGARETIKRFRPHILFEYEVHTWGNLGLKLENAIDLLRQFDYTFYVVQHQAMVRLTKLEHGASGNEFDILAVPCLISEMDAP